MITDYASLQAQIASTLKRQDLTASIPTYIQLAEAEFNRRLDVMDMEGVLSSTFTDDFTLPADYNGIKSAYLDLGGGQKGNLTETTQQQIIQLSNSGAQGQPTEYAISAGKMVWNKIPDTTYTLVITYMKTIPALSGSNTTNWLLTDHPDLYLYGSLLHSAPDLKNDSRIQTWRYILDGAPGDPNAPGLYDQIKRNDRQRRFNAQVHKRRSTQLYDGYKAWRR